MRTTTFDTFKSINLRLHNKLTQQDQYKGYLKRIQNIVDRKQKIDHTPDFYMTFLNKSRQKAKQQKSIQNLYNIQLQNKHLLQKIQKQKSRKFSINHSLHEIHLYEKRLKQQQKINEQNKLLAQRILNQNSYLIKRKLYPLVNQPQQLSPTSKNQIIFKNFYKQQLDDLLTLKNKQKQLQKQKNQQQRVQYNERLRLQQQAQRIKQISYKNVDIYIIIIQYYQMIMSNQQHLKNQYINPFQQREQLKNKLINKQYEEGKIKNQIEYEKELKRQDNIKRQLQNVLNYQVNQKQYEQKKSQEDKIKQNQNIRQVLLTPHEIQQQERQRKLNQMNKYRQDLDKLTLQKMNLSRSKANNPQYLNSPKSTIFHDPFYLELQRHDLLLNPLPYNIQNPYILKQMQKRSMLSSNYNASNNMSNSTHQQQYSPKNINEGSKKNIFN